MASIETVNRRLGPNRLEHTVVYLVFYGRDKSVLSYKKSSIDMHAPRQPHTVSEITTTVSCLSTGYVMSLSRFFLFPFEECRLSVCVCVCVFKRKT